MITALQMNLSVFRSKTLASDGNFSSVKFDELANFPTLQKSLLFTFEITIIRKTSDAKSISSGTETSKKTGIQSEMRDFLIFRQY